MGTELKAQTTVCPGVEYCITLDSMRGTIQWQSSLDGGATYADINGETGDSLCFIPTADAFYRAVLTTEPGCAPVISDAIDIQLSDLTADAGADQRMCEMDSVMLGGSPAASGGAGGYTYNWIPNGATTSNPMVSPAATTDYVLEVTDADGCVDMDTVNVVVDVNLAGIDTFNVTGNVQFFVVPECRTNTSDSVFIECWGAMGRQGSGTPAIQGGLGGYASGNYYIGNVDTLFIYVGANTGYNGGAAGGSGDNPGGSGGGASDVRVGSLTQANRIIVAGGGGGAGGRGLGSQPAGEGGSGGGISGANGFPDASQTASIITHSQPGVGGTQGGGGTGGAGMVNCNNTGGLGFAGSIGTGGTGGDGLVPGPGSSCQFPTIAGLGGGGGGGGYFGGGGGGGGVGVGEPGAGGGGGSSYIGGVTDGVTTAAVNSGNGRVIIHW
jgi:hypothetical protein